MIARRSFVIALGLLLTISAFGYFFGTSQNSTGIQKAHLLLPQKKVTTTAKPYFGYIKNLYRLNTILMLMVLMHSFAFYWICG